MSLLFTFIHDQHLVTKILSDNLNKSLHTLVTTVNKLKYHILKNQFWIEIENDEDFLYLLFHAEIH